MAVLRPDQSTRDHRREVHLDYPSGIQLQDLSTARATLRAALARFAVAGPAFVDTVVVAHELLTNAAHHGREPIGLVVSVSDVAIGVHVSDHGPPFAWPLPPPARDLMRRTHGLNLVAAFSNAYGVTDDGPNGKTVWASITRYEH